MFKTSHDEKSNRVVLRYEGNVDVKEAEELHLHLQTLIPKCRPGFKLLVDLSSVEAITLEVIPFIRKIMVLCNKHGVAEVIRIIPDPDKDIGFNILSVFHYDENVKVVTRRSLENADW